MDKKIEELITDQEIQDLKGLIKRSTRVVSWYPHSQHDGYHPGKASVRGPFGRWFLIEGGEAKNGEPTLGEGVADLFDDAKFAAAAMNNLERLLDVILLQRAENRILKSQIHFIDESFEEARSVVAIARGITEKS